MRNSETEVASVNGQRDRGTHLVVRVRTDLHPIFFAIDVIAAHCESYWFRCSSTIRTERSRTSGENLLGLAMTPSSQGMEPPGIPERFTWRAPGVVVCP